MPNRDLSIKSEMGKDPAREGKVKLFRKGDAELS